MTVVIANSAETQPLQLRCRPDLHFSRQHSHGRRVWVVKDPASLEYFTLSDEERFLLESIDGEASLTDICEQFESQFAPRRLDFARLQSFIGMLHREGLLIGNMPGQADVLLERRRERAERKRWQSIANLLAMRFRGVDPQAFLDWLYPLCRWIFSTPACAVWGLVVLAAILLAAVRWDAVVERLPTMEQFLGGGNVVWLLITLAAIKVLHELGHALACRHFGRECHEIGPMLLLFTPCLYCNVSDAWMLPSKWQRAAIAAAGIAVELVLASIATFVWWWSEPGLLNSLALNVMVVGSISTLLLNGNPLLKYDGYHVLADLTESPNLGEQSAEQLRTAVGRWYFGDRIVSKRPVANVENWAWLMAYAVAAMVYRAFVVVTVLWCLQQWLKPVGFAAVVPIIALMAVGGLLGGPVWRWRQFMRDPRWSEQINWPRFYLRIALSLVVAAAAISLPLPGKVNSPAVAQLAGARRVYVTIPGAIEFALPAAAVVKQGDPIMQLRNQDIALEVDRMLGEVERQQLHVANLERVAVNSTVAAEELPTASSRLSDLEQQLRERERDAERLIIRAPIGGTLIAPPKLQIPVGDKELAQWNGTPLDPENIGAMLTTGTLVGSVGDPRAWEAVALVDQSDVQFVRVGQRVALRLDMSPGNAIIGEVVEISPANVEDLPAELLSAEVETKKGESGKLELVRPAYQARIKLEITDQPLVNGTAGNARIEVESQSLASRIVRYLSRTFRLEW